MSIRRRGSPWLAVALIVAETRDQDAALAASRRILVRHGNLLQRPLGLPELHQPLERRIGKRLVIVHGQNRHMFLHRQPALYTVEMLRKDRPERLLISLIALYTLPLQHGGLGSQDFRHRPLHEDDLIRMLGGKILEQR